MGKYKPQEDSQGLSSGYTCTDCGGDRLCLHTHPRSSRLFTHTHLTPSLTPTLTPTPTPALTPTLAVAAACPKGHYRTGCGGLQFHDDSSDTRTQMSKAMASQCDLLHGPSGSRLH